MQRGTNACLLGVLLLMAIPGGAAPNRGARFFAVQPRHDLAYCDTYAHYRDHLTALVTSQVQPRLARDRPNVIVFPEDVGLPAAFIGSRGAVARAQTSVAAAYGSLFMGDMPPYGLALYYYAQAFPELPPQRLPNLALTDTLWRAFYETMSEVAVQTKAWVVASTDVSGVVVRAGLGDLPAEAFYLLSDPDMASDYVYLALDPNVYNTTFVFSPTGQIVAASRKPYLVPDEEQLLGFSYGAVGASEPVDLGFARLGFFCSKPAWMPDVIDRFSILGADTFVQPEMFGGWAIPDDVTHLQDWLPDAFIESGWSAVQKESGLRCGIVAHMTGNLFDYILDGQSAILTDAVPGITDWAYIGQPTQGGFAATAPWVMPDPGIADPTLPLDIRRLLLRQTGLALMPGGELDNQYVETVICADLEPAARFRVQPTGPAGALGRSREVVTWGAGEQTHPAAAAYGQTVAIVWQDTRDGQPQVYARVSTNGGHTFLPAVRVAPSRYAQRTPAVTVTPTGIVVAWQEERNGERRIMATCSSFLGFAPARALPTTGPADEWLPALAWGWGQDSRVRFPVAYLAFVQTLGDTERVMVARGTVGRGAWQLAAADPGAPVWDTPNPRNNQWAPSIAVHGSQVAVAWTDFRLFSWDVMVSVSTDGAVTFGAPIRAGDGPDGWERLNSEPYVSYNAAGDLICTWTDIRQRQPNAQVRVAVGSATAFLPSTVIPLDAPAGSCSWRSGTTLLGDGRVVAAWQDFRTLGNDIYLAASGNGGATFGAGLRIDDGGDGPSYQFAPRLAGLGRSGVLVVWEDTRSGRRQVRYAVGNVPR